MRRKPAIWHDQLEEHDPIFDGRVRFVFGNRAQHSEDDDSQPQEVRILIGPFVPIEEAIAQLEAEEAAETEEEDEHGLQQPGQ